MQSNTNDENVGSPLFTELEINEEIENGREVLSAVDYDTNLGISMGRDARKVSEGELSSEMFWEKYDEKAREEFGVDYEDTPNPAVDHTQNQTIDEDVAEDLNCDNCSLSSVAEHGNLTTEQTGTAENNNQEDSENAEEEKTPRWGMVIDLQKCVGCESCTTACKAENRTPPGVSYNVVMEREHGEFPNVTRTHVPRPCLQCENPPCVQVCPVTATYKLDNGIVTIDYDRCIGCRYCLIACPYGARYFDFGEDYEDEFTIDGETKVAEYGKERTREDTSGHAMKCNYCYHRLERGEEPACVETCIGDARYIGDLDDEDSDVAKMANEQRAFQLREGQGTNPNMYYLQ